VLLRRTTLHNEGPFKHYVFDVENLRGVVAITAPNGTGKSSVLELGLLGAAYRKTETQGTLVGRATDREAWVETELTYGHPFTIRQVVDGVSRASETLLLDAAGTPILADTKVTTFAAWAARHLPDPDVYLAGPFGAQKSEGFVAMSSAERIAVILRVLGVARLERMAKAAAARATKAQQAFELAEERIKAVRGSDPGPDAAEADLLAAKLVAAASDEVLAGAKAALAARRQEVADHAVRKAKREAADKLLATLQEQAQGAADRLANAELRIKGNQQIQADAEAIRAAAAALEAANAELTRLELALVEADKQIAGLLDPWRDGQARARSASQRRAAAQARLADRAKVETAVAGKADLAAAAQAMAAVVAATEAEIKALGSQQLAGADDRIRALSEGHERILATPPDGGHAISAAALDADRAGVAAAVEVPRQAKALEERLRAERDQAAVAARALADAEKLAARAGDVEAAAGDLAAAARELDDITTAHALAVLSAALRALGRRELATAIKAQAVALEPMRKLAGRLPALDDSDRRLGELDQQMAAAKADLDRAAEQIAAVEVVEVGAPPDLAGAEAALAGAESGAAAAGAAVAKADATLARACATAAKVVALEAERAAAAAELADWTRLELDLGRKGIQSAEVDSAGPELTALANDLLHRCHSNRFTVEVKTQRLDAKGKTLVDECNVRVIDSLRGTDKELREHSGGERVLLGEALSLALTMMGCRRAGFSDFTIVRDESGAALDAENNRAYVAMLRHALAVTGARHVLLVSHSQEVQEMCDHVIEIPEAA
jgi:exonuclease SbcC